MSTYLFYDIFVSMNFVIIRTGNSASPVRWQALTKVGLLPVGHFWITSPEIWSQIIWFPFQKMRLKMSSAKCQSFCYNRPTSIWYFLMTVLPKDTLKSHPCHYSVIFALIWYVSSSSMVDYWYRQYVLLFKFQFSRSSDPSNFCLLEIEPRWSSNDDRVPV